MQNEIKKIKPGFLVIVAFVAFSAIPAMAVDEDEWAEEVSANAIAQYDAQGSIFQRITDLEQEKVLMQLEKEKAQLDLELDRLAAEKIRLLIEIDTLSGRADEQQQELAQEKAKLEAEASRLEKERQSITAKSESVATRSPVKTATVAETAEEDSISKKYRLMEIIGAGKQLQATLEDAQSGQRKKITVGKILDGYSITSISLDDGVVFIKDGHRETLNIGKGK